MATGHILLAFYAFLSSFIFDLLFSCLESDVLKVQSSTEVLNMSALKISFSTFYRIDELSKKKKKKSVH